MARIELVEKESAPAGVRALYEEFESLGVPLLNVAKVFANHEDVLGGFIRIAKALYATPALDPRYRELAYLRTSQLNSCHY